MYISLRSLRGIGIPSGSGLGRKILASKHKEAAELSGLLAKRVADKSDAEKRFERLFK